MSELHYTDNETKEKYVMQAYHGSFNTKITLHVNGEYIGSQTWIGGDYLGDTERSLEGKDRYTITKSYLNP